jgi:hypothetical protein
MISIIFSLFDAGFSGGSDIKTGWSYGETLNSFIYWLGYHYNMHDAIFFPYHPI